MQSPKSDNCKVSRWVAITIGGLSFIASLIGLVKMYLQSYYYLTRYAYSTSFLDGSPDVGIEVLCILLAILAGLMIVGARNERPAFMFPWLATHIVGVAICLSFFITLIVNGIRASAGMWNVGDFSAALVITAVITVVAALLFAGVYNHYSKLVFAKSTDSSLPYAPTEPTIIKTDLMKPKCWEKKSKLYEGLCTGPEFPQFLPL